MTTELSLQELSALDIYLGKTLVGTLTKLPSDQIVFSFVDAYIEDNNRPMLSLAFKSASGGLITNSKITKTRLLPFFSNLLPEGHMREYLAEQAGIHPQREFFLLAALGEDLPGAVRVQPKYSLSEQTLEKKQISSAKQNKNKRMSTFRFSLAGVQLKFSAILENSGGLTIPVNGVGGSWIAKLPSARFTMVPENEFSMMTLASKIGINIPEIKLVPTKSIKGLPQNIPENFGKNFDSSNSLAVKRFDRTSAGRRIHMEDFAQIYNLYPEQKYNKASYANIASVIWIEMGEDALLEFVRRLVFSVAIGNADMHLKNWSIIYPNGREPQLSPAYDLVSTITYLKEKEMVLSVAGTKDMNEFSSNLLRKFTAKAKLPEHLVIRTALEAAAKIKEVWSKEKKHLLISREFISVIDNHMKQIPLLHEA